MSCHFPGAHTSPCSKSNGACQSICVERPFNATSFTPLNRTCLCSDIFQRVYAADGSESCECEANEVIDGESCKPGNGMYVCYRRVINPVMVCMSVIDGESCKPGNGMYVL